MWKEKRGRKRSSIVLSSRDACTVSRTCLQAAKTLAILFYGDTLWLFIHKVE